MKRPAPHVPIKIREVGILFARLVKWHNAVNAAQEFDQRRLADTDIACNGNRFTSRNVPALLAFEHDLATHDGLPDSDILDIVRIHGEEIV